MRMLDGAQLDDIHYDPFDVKVMSNPHPYYERLRNEAPVLVQEFLSRVNSYSFELDEAILRPSYFHWAYASLPVKIQSEL